MLFAERAEPELTLTEKGHGRLERRQIWTSDELMGYIDFPGLKQVLKIKKRVERKTKEPVETVHYALTSLSASKAGPQKLAGLVRAHWGIENKLFHVKDDSFGEDRHVLQSHHRGTVLSLLRNTAMNLLRADCRLWSKTAPLTGRAQYLGSNPLSAIVSY